MPVEIPVYIDIDQAIKQAIQEIPKEMPSLQKVINNHTLNLKFDIGYESGKETLRNILTDDEIITAKELKRALVSIREEFDKISKANANTKKTSEVKNLAKAYALVEQRLTGVYNKTTAAMLMTQDAINKTVAKMAKIRSALPTASYDEYNKLNYQLRIQQQRYAELVQQMVKYKAQAAGINTEVSRQTSLFSKLATQMGAYVSVYSALRFAKQIRDVTGELEYQRVALGHLLQDEEYGAQLFERIKAAAIESPFRITQLVTYTKQLAAYRIEQENLFDTTQRLADISAGLGVDMNRLILAYGQVRAASVLRGQELRQFTEAGIPLVDELAKKFTELKGEMVSTADVFKLISARAVPFEYIAEIFEDLTDKGGMFYKMQEEQAKTLKGRWEKLKDAYDIALQSIGENDTFQAWNDQILKSLTSIAKNLRQIVKIANAAGIAWGVYAIATRTALSANIKFSASLVKEFGLVKTLSLGVAGLTSAFKKLVTVLKSNWVGLALSAVAGLITYFTTFKKKADDVTDSIDEMEEAIEKMSMANKESNKEERLINRYVRLAENAKRTADENLALSQTMNKLRDAYPDLIDVIGDENIALEEQARLLEEAREKKLSDSKKEAEERLNIEQELNAGLQKQYDEALQAYNDAYKKLTKAQQAQTVGADELNKTVKDLLSEEDAINMISDLDLDKMTKDAAILAAQARKDLDEINDKLTASNKKITRLENVIDPSKQQAEWKEWQNQIKAVQDGLIKVGDTPVFTDDEISGFESVYDLSGKLKKKIDDLTTSLSGMKKLFESIADKNSDSAIALDKEIKATEKTLEMAEAIRIALGLVFSKVKSGGVQTDPFITLMQNRMKFMQDFKKGYEDLAKVMTSSQAKMEESSIMLGRGQSLGLGAEEQLRAVNGLSGWYEDMIKNVQDKLRAKGIKGATPTDFLSIDTTKKSKAIQDLQKLLQSLWDAKTDYDTSQKKKDIEDALKRLSDEIKQTETARNFYRDVLDLTGDEDLAATMSVSIYGGVGDDFRDRMQQQLDMAMRSIDGTELTNELREAFENQDFGTILQNLDKFPEEWRKRVQEMASDSQKFEADRAKDLLKALQRAKTYADQQVELAKQTAKRTADIQSLRVDDDVRKQMLKDNARKEAEESAKIAYEAFKDTPMYVELFSDLDQASMRMLTNMRENLEKMKDNWKNLHPRELKELQSRLNELDEQIALRNPFKALANSIKEYYEMQKNRKRVDVEEAAIAANEKLMNEEALLEKYRQEYMATSAIEGVSKVLVDLMKKRMEDQAKVVDESKKAADDAQQEANQYKRMADLIDKAADKMQEWAGYVSGSLDGIQEIVGTFASDDFSETFGIIAEGLGKTVSGTAQLGKGIAELMTANPQGLVDTFQGLGNVLSGTFGSAKQLSIKKLNKKIQDQQDLLDGLTYSYDRLEKSMAKAFGSDYIYNYNEQLKNLQAQQAAYEEQLRLEQNKGKKKDKEKIKDYQDSIQEVEDQILDMNGGLSEFFSGTDVRSAAEEFANSWIEAYKSFSSTTGAMRDKFQEMIGNMITQSLAGQMMQRLLQPIFNEIDKLSEDGELTAAEIGSISDMAIAAIPQIDSAMTGLVNNLAGAGINLRQQAGQFTGISRDIAGASEESILGLAAAVNTANFYISHVPTISENVAAIREALTGESGGGRRNVATRGDVEGPTYEDQMLAYASAIPTMRDDMAVMRSLLERVIKPVGVSATHYVAIR